MAFHSIANQKEPMVITGTTMEMSMAMTMETSTAMNMETSTATSTRTSE